jgi:hypothetical protein
LRVLVCRARGKVTRIKLEGLDSTDARMSDEPAVAVAVGVPQGGEGGPGVVVAKAVGAAVPQIGRQHSQSVQDDNGGAPVAIAEAFIYSPFMAKVFAGLDEDRSGFLNLNEVEAALKKCGLNESLAAETVAGCDKNNDNKISLAEWEAGLKPEVRAAIEATASVEGDL